MGIVDYILAKLGLFTEPVNSQIAEKPITNKRRHESSIESQNTHSKRQRIDLTSSNDHTKSTFLSNSSRFQTNYSYCSALTMSASRNSTNNNGMTNKNAPSGRQRICQNISTANNGPSTSSGGARPKSLIEDVDTTWVTPNVLKEKHKPNRFFRTPTVDRVEQDVEYVGTVAFKSSTPLELVHKPKTWDNFLINSRQHAFTTLNDVRKNKEYADYAQMLKSSSLNSNLSSKHNFHTLKQSPHHKTFIDLTIPSKDDVASRRRIERVITVESDDEVVVVEPVNTLKKDLQLHQEFDYIKWSEALTQKHRPVQQTMQQKVKDEQMKAQHLHDNNKRFDSVLEKRFIDTCRIRDYVILDEDVGVVLPPLSQEQEDLINGALFGRRSPSEVLVTKFKLSITRNLMQCLSKLNWLNDEVINFYMNLLTERGQDKKKASVYAMNTFFCSEVIKGGHAKVKRWTRKDDIFSYDLIPVPVHVNGIHWCMAMIDFRKKSIKYYDSMGSANNLVLKALEQYLKDESLDKKKKPFDNSGWIKENVKNIPQQLNGSDCGVFSCMFAEYLCRDAEITFSQDDMPYFRRKMVLEILQGHLIT